MWAASVLRPRGGERWVGIITGDMMKVQNVDIWINPENTKMEMARPDEFSTSGMIRFFGGFPEAGDITDDVIARALKDRVGDNVPVSAGSAFETTSGALERSNNVRHIIHVAAVEGRPAAGFQQVDNVDQCIANALSLADDLVANGSEARSVLFPLLGAGVGRAAPEPTAYLLLQATVDYLEDAEKPGVDRVYFLAYNAREYEALLSAFQRVDKLGPLRKMSRREVRQATRNPLP